MWDVRAISEPEADLFRSRLSRTFGVDMDTEADARDRFLQLFEIDRTFAAFHDGDLVGTGGAFTFELTVPGGIGVEMGGTTIIGVQPTHRRRGILTEMMAYHLDEVAGRGEAIAGLWASESSIYRRFGFGIASYMYETKMHTPSIIMSTPDPSGRVRLVEAAEAEPLIRPIYEEVRTGTAGMLSRSDAWWKLRIFREPENISEGRSKRRYAVYEDEGRPRGYAIYRQKQKWDDFPEGEIHVSEVISATPDAHRALWGLLTDVDLFPKLEWWNSPIDDPLPFHVTDPRRIQREMSDALWIRLIDVPTAIASRRYQEDGELVVAVDDHFLPDNSGTYLIEVVDGAATCERVDTTPDVRCTVDVLGHLYLGGGDAMGLAHAGVLQGGIEDIRTVHRIFRTDRAPWCQEIF